MIDLLLLGNGAMVPLPNRPLSSLLVRSQASLLLRGLRAQGTINSHVLLKK